MNTAGPTILRWAFKVIYACLLALMIISGVAEEGIRPWINITLVIAVPTLLWLNAGIFLVRDNSSSSVWVILVTLTALGLILALSARPGVERVGAAVLVGIPLLQAVAFVAADKLFQVLVGRPPLPYGEYYRRRRDGEGLWSDGFFWVIVYLALIIGGLLLAMPFDSEFPTRAHR